MSNAMSPVDDQMLGGHPGETKRLTWLVSAAVTGAGKALHSFISVSKRVARLQVEVRALQNDLHEIKDAQRQSAEAVQHVAVGTAKLQGMMSVMLKATVTDYDGRTPSPDREKQ